MLTEQVVMDINQKRCVDTEVGTTLAALSELSRTVKALLEESSRDLELATLYHLGDLGEFAETRPGRGKNLHATHRTRTTAGKIGGQKRYWSPR